MYHILYVDDEPPLLEIGKLFLEQSGQFSVETITSASAALTLLETKSYDAIISDYQMPGLDGITFLKAVRSSGKSIPFILFTGRGREEVVIQALNEGADFYIQKGGELQSQFADLSSKIHYAVMRRRAEESLKQNEAQLRQIIDLVPHMIFAKDAVGNVLLANRAVAQRYNKNIAEIVGKPQALFETNTTNLRHNLDEDLEVITTGTPKFIPEDTYIDVFGNRRITQTTKVPFTTAGNNQQAVLGVVIDITEQKEAEEALRESQRMLAEAMDLANMVTWECDLKTGLLTFDDRFSILYGIKTDRKGIGHMTAETYCREFVHPKDLSILLEEDEKTRTTTDPHYVAKREYRIIRGDGAIRHIEMCVGIKKDALGQTVKVHGVNHDITEQKEAETALRESQRMLAEAMDLANMVTWECDIASGVLTFDDRFSTLYGSKAEHKCIHHMTAEQYLQEVVHPEDLSILLEEDEKTRTTTDPHYVAKREYRIIRGDGAIRHIEMCVGIIKDALGQTVKVHGVNHDITEQKEAEEALRRANHQLNLLSGITRHDVLNKITGIFGYLKLAEMKFSDPTLGAYLGKIESAITDIQSQLEFNQIYQDLNTYEPQWIDLETTMPRSQVPATMSLNTSVQGVEVFASPLMGKVFFNLLDNSIRHGQRVTEIRVMSQQSGDDLDIVWEDNGVGVAADEKERIFEDGYGKNTGLGMFLIREILSLTGITIKETGTPGNGARFEIIVPKRQYRFTHHQP